MTANRKDVKVRIQDLCKTYYQHPSTWSKVAEHLRLPFGRSKLNEHNVLSNLNLEVLQGERVGIIGRNGAGKSTLLRIISGLMRPTSGSVQIRGTINALFDTSTGFHPDFTGRQNVYVNLAYRGITGREAECKVEEVIDFSELYDFIDQPFKTYSAGMMSRLTFSVATILKPDILIIDEILGAGDAYFAAKCMDRMKEITSGGATVLLVSHSLGAVLQFSTRAIWIDRGGVQCDGRPIDVIEHYQKSVEHYERLRMMAKNAKLRLKLSPSTVSGTYGRYLLFRLVSANPGDGGEVRVGKIRLLENGSELYAMDVGGAMDDSTSYPIFISNGDKQGAWSKSARQGERFYRSIHPGAAGELPSFLSLFPLETRPGDRFQVSLEACAARATGLALEVMDASGVFRRLEPALNLPAGRWDCHTLALPENVYTTPMGSNGLMAAAAPAREEAAETPEVAESPAVDAAPPLRKAAPVSANVQEQFPSDNGPVFIVNYTMYKGDRKEAAFEIGDAYVGEIDFFCAAEIPMPSFVVNITRVDGIRMRQSVSRRDGLPGGTLKPGYGKVRFNLDSLYFGPGSYVVSIGIFEIVDLMNDMTMSPPMSLRSNAYEFQVIPPRDVRVDMGCCQLPGRWEYVRKSA